MRPSDGAILQGWVCPGDVETRADHPVRFTPTDVLAAHTRARCRTENGDGRTTSHGSECIDRDR